MAEPVRLRSLSIDELLDELEAARPAGAAALAFDADGTLWSGDVGEDALEVAAEEGALREPAREALSASAGTHGLDPAGSASQLGARILAAFRAGAFPTLAACEVMTWCWAGWSPEELRAYARAALVRRSIGSRLHRELEPVLAWARRTGTRAIVISASPLAVLEQAAPLWGFAPPDLVAGVPALENGRIAPRLAAPLPYGAEKLAQGRARIGSACWLGSFADNVYDLEMLHAARVGVAVRPKIALLERLRDEPGIALLA